MPRLGLWNFSEAVARQHGPHSLPIKVAQHVERGKASHAATLGFTQPTKATSTTPQRRDTVPPPSAAAAAPHKPCPDCAEEVRAAARKCRFCGHMFDAAPVGEVQR